MTSLRTHIESLGVALPAKRVTTEEVVQGCRVPLDFPLAQWTGIQARRRAGDDEFAVDLAERAIATCMARSSYRPGDIDVVINCNIARMDSPGKVSYEPATASRLAARAGLHNALTFDITNACAGMFTGVALASEFLATARAKRVLVVSGEYISHLTDVAQREITDAGYADPALPCLTLGDAGAALVLDRIESSGSGTSASGDCDEPGFHFNDLLTLSRYSHLCVSAPTYKPEGGALMKTDTQRLGAVGTRESVRHLRHVMTHMGCQPSDFNHHIAHQVSLATLTGAMRAANEAFGDGQLHAGNVIINLEERGNTASTSHFVALWDACRDGRIQSNERVLFTTIASGLVVGTAAYTLDDLPDRLRADPPGKNAEPSAMGGPVVARWSTAANDFPRICFESVALTEAPPDSDSFKLAASAGEAALRDSRHSRRDFSHLIFFGMHRTDWLSEPAAATFVARELRMNEAWDPERATLAFDLTHGGTSFLCVCEVARQLIAADPKRALMLLSSEIDPNVNSGSGIVLGIEPSGAAVSVHAADNAERGLGSIVIDRLPEQVEVMRSDLWMGGGVTEQVRSGLHYALSHLLEVLPSTVAHLLELDGLTLGDLDVLIVAEPAPELGRKVAAVLGLSPERLLQPQTPFCDRATCALPYAVHDALRRGSVHPGSVGLLIELGSGLQAACAIYRF